MISVIVPCYNYGHLIADTINSILDQSYAEWELFVIDDGSTDNTKDVVLEFCKKDDRVHYVFQPNSGLGAARNKGLECIKGEFVQFLDADDLVEKNKFRFQIDFFKGRPDIDIMYGSVRYFTKNPYDPADRLLTYWGPNVEWMPKLSGFGRDFLPKALKGNFSHLSSLLLKRSIVEKVRAFNNEFSAVADYHFQLRCVMENANFYYHDTPGTYSLVRWHPNNMSKDPNFMRVEEIKMRRYLETSLTGNEEASINNQRAIEGLTLLINRSWKTIFLSGGPFDFLKKVIRVLGLEKIFRKIFYRSLPNRTGI